MIGDVNNNVVNIKVLLSVSSVLLPFLMPDTCRGEFLFFLPNQRKWIGKTPCCYNCGTPPTLFWPNPLPSSVNPCEGVLVPMGCPCAGFMPLWNTCEQGDTQALPGFPSPPQLEVLPPPRNHTVSSPSMEVQKIYFRTGCWDVTVTRQIVPRFLTTSSCQCLGVYCCVGPVVQGAFATVWLLPSEGWAGVFLRPCGPRLTAVWPSKTEPLSQFLWWRLFVSGIGTLAQQRPGRASVYPPLQSIKRSLNVKYWSVYFNIYTLHEYLSEVHFECHHLPTKVVSALYGKECPKTEKKPSPWKIHHCWSLLGFFVFDLQSCLSLWVFKPTPLKVLETRFGGFEN